MFVFCATHDRSSPLLAILPTGSYEYDPTHNHPTIVYVYDTSTIYMNVPPPQNAVYVRNGTHRVFNVVRRSFAPAVLVEVSA